MTIDDKTREAMERKARTLFVNYLRDGDRTIWVHYFAGHNEVDRATFESEVRTLPSAYTIFVIKDKTATYDDMLEWLEESRGWTNGRA